MICVEGFYKKISIYDVRGLMVKPRNCEVDPLRIQISLLKGDNYVLVLPRKNTLL